MNRKIIFYNYTFLILSILILVCCIYKIFLKQENYSWDVVVYDTKPVAGLEPEFLKDIENPLEPEPIPFSEDNEITKCYHGKEIIFSVYELPNQILLNTIEKTIDSIKLNNLERRVSIQIVLDKHTSYQTFIDIWICLKRNKVNYTELLRILFFGSNNKNNSLMNFYVYIK